MMEQINEVSTPINNEEELSKEERIVQLEKRVDFLMEVMEKQEETNTALMKGLNKLIEQSKKDQGEITRWSTATEKRIQQLLVQQSNLAFTFNTLYPVTEEQKEILEKRAKEIKDKKKQELKDK